MGIPDLMRFVAGDAAGALRKIPSAASRTHGVPFDYVLVDLTNALQTVKLPVLLKLLGTQLCSRIAVVLVLDGQRSRQGTAREQRQFLQQRDADIAVAQIAHAIYEACGCGASARTETPKAAGLFGPSKKAPRAEVGIGGDMVPRVVVCGREVAGEGDYKLLSLHRRLIQYHNSHPTDKSPTFAFVSEDADVLCGAMAGPSPHKISIATTLHDALHEPHLLNVGCVLRRLYSTSGLIEARQHHTASDAGPDAVDLRAPKKTTFGDDDDDQHDLTAKSGAPARRAKVLPQQEDIQGAALDFMFLFALVLGGSTTPAITRGATRVDAAACWQHYSSIVSGKAKTRSGKFLEQRTTILRFASATDPNESTSSVVVDAELLSTVLEARFADDRSRVPTAEERKYARDFLRHLVRSTVLLAVGAPHDTRRDAGAFEKPPAVSSLTAVLERHEERAYDVSFDFTMYPVASTAGGTVETEPLRQLSCFVDDTTQRGVKAPSGVPVFWPPRNARPVSTASASAVVGVGGRPRLSVAEVPLPLGATPASLNVELAVLASMFAASIHQDVFVGATNTLPADAVAAATFVSGPKGVTADDSVAGMTWDFDMRRMVPATARNAPANPMAETNGGERSERAKRAILASAGLSASYFDAAAAQQARKEWEARGVEMRLKRVTQKVTPPSGDADADASARPKPKKKQRLGKRERARAAKQQLGVAGAGKSKTRQSRDTAAKHSE